MLFPCVYVVPVSSTVTSIITFKLSLNSQTVEQSLLSMEIFYRRVSREIFLLFSDIHDYVPSYNCHIIHFSMF